MDYYRVLQVTREADPEVIERAYKALSRKYHPDRNAVEPAATTGRMQRINEAYAVLGNPRSRLAYDLTLPPADAGAWDVFWERGLVGMYRERFRQRPGGGVS